jgi:hypothetical protein
MRQTGYIGVTTLSYGLPFRGGFCEWWYTKREDINLFPVVDPNTQYLVGEPTLKTGKFWFGPVLVPDDQLGFEEPMQRTAAGFFYKQKVSGFYPGDDIFSRENISNMPFHEYVIIGRVRAGGFFLVLGNDQQGFQFDEDYATGNGAVSTAGSRFAFSKANIDKGQVLLTFSESPEIAPPGILPNDGTGGDIDFNDAEVIPFTSGDVVKPINWSVGGAYRSRFGLYPEIQVWTSEGKIITPITINAPYPDTTEFIVALPGVDGWIVLK